MMCKVCGCVCLSVPYLICTLLLFTIFYNFLNPHPQQIVSILAGAFKHIQDVDPKTKEIVSFNFAFIYYFKPNLLF